MATTYVDPRRKAYRDSKTGNIVTGNPSGPLGGSPRYSIADVANDALSSPGTTPKGGVSYAGPQTTPGGGIAPLGGLIPGSSPVGYASTDRTGGRTTRRSTSAPLGESNRVFGQDSDVGGTGLGFQQNYKISDVANSLGELKPRPIAPEGGVGVLGGNAINFGQGVLGAVPMQSLTPEQQAQRTFEGSLGLADETLALGEKNFRDTLSLAGDQSSESINAIKDNAALGMTQAEREKELALGQQDIDKAKADKEYEAAIAQQDAYRTQENEYLMQKLASAGAIDSTAGIQIITKSAQKYDSIIGSLQGDRQIALAQFAQNDAVIRNSYMSAIETIATSANDLIRQIQQNYQTLALSASQQLGQTSLEAQRQKQDAINTYYSNLNSIRAAQAEAEASAAEAVTRAHQQAFENAIALAGLTGTYIDPITGEAIRTINGIKLDRGTGGGSSGGKIAGFTGPESALIQDIARSAIGPDGSVDLNKLSALASQNFTQAKVAEAYNAAKALTQVPSIRKSAKDGGPSLGTQDNSDVSSFQNQQITMLQNIEDNDSLSRSEKKVLTEQIRRNLGLPN